MYCLNLMIFAVAKGKVAICLPTMTKNAIVRMAETPTSHFMSNHKMDN